MRSPACATAALVAIDRLLSHGAAPASILLVTSSWQSARLLEHVVDFSFPFGSYQLTCTSVWGLSARLLSSQRARSVLPTILSQTATSALLRRQLAALPLRRFRPANDPFRYVGPLEEHFESLQYAGVSPHEYVAYALREGEPAPQLNGSFSPVSEVARELATAYAAWSAIKAESSVIERAGVMSTLVEALQSQSPTLGGEGDGSSERKRDEKNNSSDKWRHVLAVDAQNFSPLGMKTLLTAFPPLEGQMSTGTWELSLGSSRSSALHVESSYRNESGDIRSSLLDSSVDVFMSPHRSVVASPAWGIVLHSALTRLVDSQNAGDSLRDAPGQGNRNRMTFEWSLRLVDEASASGHPDIIGTVAARLSDTSGGAVSSGKSDKGKKRALQSQSDSVASKNSPAVSLFNKDDLAVIGADHVQSLDCASITASSSAAAAPGQAKGAPNAAFIEAVGVPPASNRYDATAHAVRLLCHKLLSQASTMGPMTMCIAARSQSAARRVYQALQTHASVSFSSAIPVPSNLETITVLCDAPTPLSEIEEVRVLLSALGCIAQPADHRHLFSLATSALYSIPVPLMASLLQRGSAGSTAAPPPTQDGSGPSGDLGGLRPWIEAEIHSPAATSSMHGGQLSCVAPAFRRLLADLDHFTLTYARTKSASAALSHLMRSSGIARALAEPSSPGEEAANAALAALLQLCHELETARTSVHTAGTSLSRRKSRTRSSGAFSSMYKGAAADGLQDVQQGSDGLPFLFTALQAAVMEHGAATAVGGGESPSAASASLVAMSDDDDEVLAATGQGAADLTGPVGARIGQPGRDDGFSVRDPAQSPAHTRCQDALEAHTTVAVVNALERARAGVGGEGLGLHDYHTASSQLAASMASGGTAITVVVTTERRALSHQYDVLVVPWATDGTLPGPFFRPVMPLPERLFAPSCHLSELVPTDAAPVTPAPVSPRDHEERARARLLALMTQARRGCLFMFPSQTLSAPASSTRRSRFLNELFGPPMAMNRAASLKAADLRGLNVGGEESAVPAVTTEPGSLLNMSFSSYDEYEWCPYRYYLSRVAKVPRPQPVPAALIYGRSLHEAAAALGVVLMNAAHAALAACGPATRSSIPALAGNQPPSPAIVHSERHERDTVGVAVSPGSQLGLAAAADVVGRLVHDKGFRSALFSALPRHDETTAHMVAAYDAIWRGETAPGSAGDPQRARSCVVESASVPAWQASELRTEACAAIEKFYAAEMGALSASLAALDAGCAPLDLPHRLSLPAYVEQYFKYPLERAGIMLSGYIDRVDVCVGPGVGAAPTAVVREFKTSMQWREAGYLGKRGKNSKQLSVYSMAARYLAGQEQPRLGESVAAASAGNAAAADAGYGTALLARMHDALEPLHVSLESIETQERHPVTVSHKQSEELVAALAARRARIVAGEFTATPSLVKCGICPFQPVCSHTYGVERSVTADAAHAGRADV